MLGLGKKVGGRKKSQGPGRNRKLTGKETGKQNGRRGSEVWTREKDPEHTARRTKQGKRTSQDSETKVGRPEERKGKEKDRWRRTE